MCTRSTHRRSSGVAPLAAVALAAGLAGAPVPQVIGQSIRAEARQDPGPAPVLHRLQYVESSNGLKDLRWENGRTILKFADLNHDGHPDIVTVGDHGSPFIQSDLHGITVWFGDGAGNWSSFQKGVFGYGGVAVGDVNNDGLLDVGWGIHHNYASNNFGDRVSGVALGDGSGKNWLPWDVGLGVDGQTWGMFATEFADINADGRLDIGSTSFGCCDGFHVHVNNGDGTWTRVFGWLGGNSMMELSTGDINNDGFPDFAMAHGNGIIWLNDGANGFTRADTNLSGGGGSGLPGLHLGDVNGDGCDDLSFANMAGGVEVWTWSPAASAWVDFSGNLPSLGGFEVTRLADMNNDGKRDVVAFGERRLVVWLGDGMGGWTPEATFTVPGSGRYKGFAVGDADHSGRADILLLTEEGGFFNGRNQLRFFREAAEPGRLGIRITDPPPNRVIRRGSVVIVDWLSAVPGRVESAVSLEISFEGASGPWTEIAAELPNSGRHQFNADFTQTTTNAWLRATVTTADGSASRVHGPIEIR